MAEKELCPELRGNGDEDPSWDMARPCANARTPFRVDEETLQAPSLQVVLGNVMNVSTGLIATISYALYEVKIMKAELDRLHKILGEMTS